MPLLVLGMNHKTAPLALREAFAIPGEGLGRVLRGVIARTEVSEALVLSTCNRVEIYAVPAAAPDAARHAVAGVLSAERGLEPSTLERHGYALSGDAALRHLLRVSASLDSLVVGEAQILGQVKEAAAFARAVGAVGPVLDRCLQAAFRAAKAVRTQTGIARATVSIGSVAVDLARRIFPSLAETRVLVVGAGKMGRVTARALAAGGVERVYVTNRNYERAIGLAEEHGWHARELSELDDLLATVDVVITCTGAQRPIIDVPRLKPVVRRRKYRPLFIVDIAVPRDVDPRVGELDTVYLYNVDDLEAVSQENLARRKDEAAAAEAIVDDAVVALSAWHRALAVKPTLAAIRRRADEIVAAEVDRALSKRQLADLDEDAQQAVRAAARAVVNKLLHPALAAVRDGADRNDGVELAALARRLFGVEDVEGDGASTSAPSPRSGRADEGPAPAAPSSPIAPDRGAALGQEASAATPPTAAQEAP